MEHHHKIYVAGHLGMVGNAIYRKLVADGFQHVIGHSHRELDLIDQHAVNDFFKTTKPDYVFLAAAKVGGILANSRYPADFIYQNIMIQTNIIEAARRHHVKRLLFLGSSCIYPRHFVDPVNEDQWMNGPLEMSNRSYAIAKIAGVELCWAYYRQYGCQYLAAMPTNLYGPNDHYDLQNSHVIPAFIKKFHEAKVNEMPNVVLWGTGTPKREFLYCEDAASACLYLMNLSEKNYGSLFSEDKPPLINIGYGSDISVAELAHEIAALVRYRGDIQWDSNLPDGTPRKLLDSQRLYELGWRPQVSLTEGLRLTYQAFLQEQQVML